MTDVRREIVEAGAGCGKTTGLVARYLEGLGIDPATGALLRAKPALQPFEILALTFTEEAARNMRTRVVAQLIKFSQHNLAREVTDKAQISTFHSHCYKILKPQLSSLGYSTDLLATPLVKRLRSRQILARLPHFARCEQLLQAFDTRGLIAFTHQLWFAKHPHFDQTQEHFLQHFLQKMESMKPLLEELKTTFAESFEDGSEFWGAILERDLTHLDLTTLSAKDYNFSRGPKKSRTGDFEEICTFAKTFRDFIKGRYHLGLIANNQKTELELHNYSRDFVAGIQAHASKYLDFSALEEELNDLLARKSRDDLKIAAPRLLLVDEFQDTNPIQYTILQALSAPETEWYFVGDPKQSIYAFRNADVRLFGELTRTLHRIGLDTNYRSAESLLAFCNLAQENLFGATSNAFDPARQSLNFGRDPCKNVVLNPALVLTESESFKENFFETLISDWTQDQKDCPIKNPTFGVLFRSWKRLYEFSDLLKQRGIDHRISGNPQYFDHLLSGLFSGFIEWAKNPEFSSGLVAVYKWTRDVLPESGPLLKEALELFASNLRSKMGSLSLESVFRDFVKTIEPHRFERGEEWAAAMEAFIDSCVNNRSLDALTLTDYAKLFLKHNRELDVSHSRLDALNSSESALSLLTIHGSKGLEFDFVYLPELFERRTRHFSNLVETDENGAVAELYLKDQQTQTPYPSLLFKQSLAEKRGIEEAEQKRLFYVAMTRAKSKLNFYFHTPKVKDPTPDPLEVMLGIPASHPRFWNYLLADLRTSGPFLEFEAAGHWQHRLLAVPLADGKTSSSASGSAMDNLSPDAPETRPAPTKSSLWSLPKPLLPPTRTEGPTFERMGVRTWIQRQKEAASGNSIANGSATNISAANSLAVTARPRVTLVTSAITSAERGKEVHALLELWNGTPTHLQALCESSSDPRSFESLLLSLKQIPELHKYFELSEKNDARVLREFPVIIELDRYRLSGIIDALYYSSPEEVILIDWKTGSTLRALSNEERIESLRWQLGVYAQPFIKRGVKVTGLGIAIGFDGLAKGSSKLVEVIFNESLATVF